MPKLALSGGVYHVAKRPGREYTFPTTSPFSATVRDLPASTRLDLGAFWEVTPLYRLQANLTNVFDTKVYEPINAGFLRTPVRRFTIGGRVSL